MLCLKIAGWVANSVDPNEMPHFVASHHGLHCLLRPAWPNTYSIVLGFNDMSTLVDRLPEKGRKEIKEIAEEMKEMDKKERGTGMKVKKQKRNIPPLPLPVRRIAGLAQL